MKKKYLLFLFLSLLITFRLVILGTSLSLHDFEECRMGTLAKEILNGTTIPYFAYIGSYEAHEAGQLLNGILIAGFYRLFGESGITLKLCWLFFSVGTYIILFFMLIKYFNRRTAIIASFLYIFSPPLFTWFNLTDTAVDSGALFFIMAVIFLNAKLLFFKKNKLSFYILYGFLLGISMSYSHYAIFVLFVSLLYQLFFNPRFFFGKAMIASLISFMVGLSPWLYLILYNKFNPFDYVSRGFTTLEGAFSKLIVLFTQTFPHSLSFKDFLFFQGRTLDYIYYFLCIILGIIFLYSVRKGILLNFARYSNGRNRNRLFIFFFIIVYILVYAFSGFIIRGSIEREYRYLLRIYPFIFIAIAILIDKLWNLNIKYRSFSLIILIFLCSLGLIGNLSMIETNYSVVKKPSIYSPYSYSWLAYKINRFSKGSRQKLIPAIKSIQSKYSPYRRAGIYKKIRLGTILNPKSFLEQCKIIGEYQESYYEGMGRGIGFFFRYGPSFQIEIIQQIPSEYWFNKYGILKIDAVTHLLHNPDYLEKLSSGLSGEAKKFYYERVGMSMGILFHGRIEDLLGCLTKFEGVYAGNLIKGLGIGLAISEDIENVIKMGDRINYKYKRDYFEGVGFSFGLQAIPDLKEIIRLGEEIKLKFRSSYYKGIGGSVGWNFTNDPTLILKLEAEEYMGGKFKMREYSHLIIGLYFHVEDEYKEMYNKGIGYGFAPWLSIHTHDILNKIIGYHCRKKDSYPLLNGIYNYYSGEGNNLNLNKKILIDKISRERNECKRYYEKE